jgi:2-keto-3-deoxy-L-rhamnonate aldolase RhmA
MAVGRCKYPPSGERSVGISRAQGYGLDFAQHIARANDEIAVILQIEHIDAVDNLEAILAVPGIDALFVGPFDLSASMNKIGRVADSKVQAAISRVTAAAAAKNLPMGIFGASADAVRNYMAVGYTLIAVGIDTMILATAATAIVDAIHS